MAAMARGWAGPGLEIPAGTLPWLGDFPCLQPHSEGTPGATCGARSAPPGPRRWVWERPGSHSPPGGTRRMCH